MNDPDEFTLEDAAHEFREALVKRVAALMGWPYKTAPVWAGLRKVAMAEGVVIGLDKLEEIAVRLESAELEASRLRKLCLELESARDERDAFQMDLTEIGRLIGCGHVGDGLARCVRDALEKGRSS